MTSNHKYSANTATVCLLALALGALSSDAQTIPQPATPVSPQAGSQAPPSSLAIPVLPKPTRPIILLDPAHGGSDPGAHLPNNAVEKDVTLAFVARLRPLLNNAGFAVISTHDADADLTTDLRAGIANHSRAMACLVIHVTTSGSGLHIVSSALPDDAPTPHNPIPWDIAQTASLPQSLRLANELGLALDRAKLPILLIRASIPPLDNLICPAVAIELAPLISGNLTPVTDAAYQQHAAQAIISALNSYRSHNIPASAATGAAR